ncbi:hypothetical protein HPO96_35765 [Kribbella sandramycini]|uniref:DUF4440 domain-containing protein n=1 Tax=Kribbella sandramycini TaxID=60450 RepID=A0A7Y4L752_9ACTN|nr:hypothetical protein [Kribbella sandramycini]MBB6568845.1 hypothetical protein [Kribbella sandramycini]NOL45614.1 hypothetical protein [Kribbella sandramycini]
MSTAYDAVVLHHERLADWLGGRAEQEALQAFYAAHHPEFTLITIDGVKLGLDELMRSLSGAHNAVPGLKIGIEQFEVLATAPEATVCRFLERHSPESARWTTAVLSADGQWLSVQETPVL